MKFGIGQSVTRKEDARFLTGRGAYVEDIVEPKALHAHVVRSPVAHARLKAVDTGAASVADGVVAVLTGADSRSDAVGGIACHTGRESCYYLKLENGQWVENDPVLKNPDEIYS